MCVKLLQSYYNVYGVQQFSPYYPSAGASGEVGLIHNIYPFYGQYAQSIQAPGFGVQYPQMAQFPFLPQHYGSSTGILSYPSSVAVATTSAGEIRLMQEVIVSMFDYQLEEVILDAERTIWLPLKVFLQ